VVNGDAFSRDAQRLILRDFIKTNKTKIKRRTRNALATIYILARQTSVVRPKLIKPHGGENVSSVRMGRTRNYRIISTCGGGLENSIPKENTA